MFDFLRRDWRQSVELEDVCIYPQTSESRPPQVQGGVRHKNLPRAFHHVRHLNRQALGTDHDWLESQPLPSEKLEGHGLFGGTFFNHFGHFMAESLHRLWAWHESKGCYDYIAIVPQVDKPHVKPSADGLLGFQRQALEYLGIPLDKLRLIKSPVVAEHLTVPAQASILGQRRARAKGYTAFMAEREAQFFARYQPTTATPPERIYVSRSPYLSRGSYAGERYVEQMLAEDGYYILRPEAMPLAEQLHYYRQAKQIVFAEGSAIHTTELLGTFEAEVAVILRRRNSYRQWVPLLHKRCGRLAVFKDAATLPHLAVKKDGAPAESQSLTVIEPSSLAKFLQQKGFTRRQNFDERAFWQMEAADIARYLLTVRLNQTFANGMMEANLKAFRQALLQRPNPYLKDAPL